MAGEDGFRIEGAVIETLGAGRFRVELANGHRLLGFCARTMRAASARLRPGDRVILKVSPCDLSKGRIVLNEQRQP
jgi:translation initiation factor IF-1